MGQLLLMDLEPDLKIVTTLAILKRHQKTHSFEYFDLLYGVTGNNVQCSLSVHLMFNVTFNTFSRN